MSGSASGICTKTPGTGARVKTGRKYPFTDIPAFTQHDDGSRGMGPRQCTERYKIEPIRHKVREIIGRRPRISSARPPFVVQWMGISTDEWMRCKDARVGWTENAYPLIEVGMSRADCVSWFNHHYPGQPIAKSSCVGCPYHSNREWLNLYRNDPDGMARTIALDEHLREPARVAVEKNGKPKYLHNSLRPLGEVLRSWTFRTVCRADFSTTIQDSTGLSVSAKAIAARNRREQSNEGEPQRMTKPVYYNDNDPFAAQWLRNLVAAGLLPAGDVDDRSITEVRPDDVKGYEQCHFFAGIGGWPYALGLAGWPIDRPAWTGSCPCQPLSGAGQHKGHADERHLWPAFSALSPSAALSASLASNLQARMGVNGSPEYVLTWKHWDMPAGALICRLRASPRRTSAADCIGWPTPRAADGHKNTRTYQGALNEAQRVGLRRSDLQTVAQVMVGDRLPLAGWPTPDAAAANLNDTTWQERQASCARNTTTATVSG